MVIAHSHTLIPMPELPEVERARALIAERALGRRIARVDDTDAYVTRPHAAGEIAAALTGRELTAAHRRGKSMWIETDGGEGPTLGLHLGMAGRIVVDDATRPTQPTTGPPATTASRSGTASPWSSRTAAGSSCATGAAWAAPCSSPGSTCSAPTPPRSARAAFRERVGHGAAPLKARIMDQSVIAGVGNLLADEALWRARLSPAAARRRPARGRARPPAPRPARRDPLGDRAAAACTPASSSSTARRDGHCPRCGTEVRRATVGGRTTYWCPEEQL